MSVCMYNAFWEMTVVIPDSILIDSFVNYMSKSEAAILQIPL